MAERNRKKHKHYRRYRRKFRVKKKLLYLLPTIIICIGIAALIAAGSANLLTTTCNIILYVLAAALIPLLVYLLCRLFANGIFGLSNLLYTLFTRWRH